MGKVKEEEEEEEEGGSPPSLPVAPERRRGHHRHRNLHQQLHRCHHQLSPPLCSGVTPLLPVVISTWTWCSMLYIISQWCMAILWCLSRSVFSYGLIDDRDWFELHVLLLLLSYGALRVAQAWEIPAVGFAICSWFAYGGRHEWQKHRPE